MDYYVYILTNSTNRVLYIGVTNNIERRHAEHSQGTYGGFTAIYKTHKLVYYETFSDVKDAIAREKQLKGWKRKKKIELIEKSNPDWQSLC